MSDFSETFGSVRDTDRRAAPRKRRAKPAPAPAADMATVLALAETLDALIAVREWVGLGRIVFETETTEAAHPVIERAFFTIGRAGGNVASSPLRGTWERARDHLAAIAKTTGATS